MFVEFPKWKYHPKMGAKLVQNPEEEIALGVGWYNTPADFPKPADPEPVKAEEPEPAKPAKSKRQKKQDAE